MGLGGYPDVSLKRARELCDGFRSMKAERVDPLERVAFYWIQAFTRHPEAAIALANAFGVPREFDLTQRALAARGRATAVRRKKQRTLKDIADAYFVTKKDTLKGEGEAGSWWSPLATHVMPFSGDKTLAQIGIDEIVTCFEPIWRTKNPTAKQAHSRLYQIIRYGSAADDFDLSILEKAKAKLGAVKHVAIHQRAAAWEDMPAIFKELKRSVADQALRFYTFAPQRGLTLRTMTRSAPAPVAQPAHLGKTQTQNFAQVG